MKTTMKTTIKTITITGVPNGHYHEGSWTEPNVVPVRWSNGFFWENPWENPWENAGKTKLYLVGGQWWFNGGLMVDLLGFNGGLMMV